MTWPPNRGHPPVKEASHVVIGPDNVQSILIAVAHRSTHFAFRFSRNARTPSSLSAQAIATAKRVCSYRSLLSTGRLADSRTDAFARRTGSALWRPLISDIPN